LFFIAVILAVTSVTTTAKQLKVGIGKIHYPPYYFVADGALRGAVIEVAQQIAKQLGHTLIFEQYPWPRIQRYLSQGKIDMVLLYSKTPQREQFAIYTDFPHMYDASYLAIKKGQSIDFDGDLSKLQRYKFGNIRGYSHGASYDSAANLSKHHANDEKQLIRMLLKGRIDIAVTNKAVMSVHAKKYGVLNDIHYLTPPIDIAPAYFAFSKARIDSVELAKQFSKQAEILLKTEEYQKILAKYHLN